MIEWIPYAFVRIVLFFIAGVLLGIRFPGSVNLGLTLLCLAILFLLFIGLALLQRILEWRTNPGWAGLVAVLGLGYLNVVVRTETNHDDHLIRKSGSLEYYEAVILTRPRKGSNTWIQKAEVKAIKSETGWAKASGKVRLYFAIRDYSYPFGHGDLLLIKGQPQEVEPPLNPHEFNYRRYMAASQIYHQHFLRGGEAVRIRKGNPGLLQQAVATLHAKSGRFFHQYIPGEKEQAVASALVLGDKTDLDKDLSDAFATSGAMHVLAVSGLHVGIIYGALLIFFRPLRKLPGGAWAGALTGVLFLWCYAMLTGLSSSVVRATTMFTFLALAGPWGRRTNIYNTLGVSALAMLIVDPYLITGVGFQLSYAAVLGIVFFYPRLSLLWEPSSVVMQKIWQISCVSMSAQLATFPISMLYFHQFPVYFLLSNLLVIPTACVILVLGLALLASAAWIPIAQLIGSILGSVIWLLNSGVEFIESLPLSAIRNIYITPDQCCVLIGLVCACFILYDSRRFAVVYIMCFLCFAFALTRWHREINEIQPEQLWVYSIPGHYALEVIRGGESYFYSDSSLRCDPEKIAYHISTNRMALAVRRIQEGTAQPFTLELKGARLMRFEDVTVIHIFEAGFRLPKHILADCIIVSQNAVKSFAELELDVEMKQLVVDGSNSVDIAKRLEREASDHTIAFHATRKDGAFELEI